MRRGWAERTPVRIKAMKKDCGMIRRIRFRTPPSLWMGQAGGHVKAICNSNKRLTRDVVENGERGELPRLGAGWTRQNVASWGTGRGRDAGYPAPPAQTRAGALNAHGSYLGYRAANRSFGHGCRTSTGGSLAPSRSRKRVHVHRLFWLRRRIWRNHKRSTSLRNPFIRSWLSGTA